MRSNNSSNLFEYLLTINPSEKIYQKTIDEKNILDDICRAPLAKVSKPHFTLANYGQFGSSQEEIVSALRSIGDSQQKIDMKLNNFGHFHSHTIFIDVLYKKEFKNLAAKLKIKFNIR